MVEKKNVSPIRSMRNTADNAAYMVSLVTQEEGGKRFILLKAIRAIISALMPVLFSVMPGLVINELIGLKRLGIIIIYVSARDCPVLCFGLLHRKELSADIRAEPAHR